MRCAVRLLCGLAMTGFVLAHDLHESTAEAEYNPATNKLEVSLRVFTSDFELALIRHSERMISLEKTPAKEVDPLIQAYLSSVFVLKPADGKPIGIEWVGREFEKTRKVGDDSAMLLYFELALPNGLSGLTLQHSLLCECYPDQVNLLHLHEGKNQVQLRFTKTESCKPVTPSPTR